MFKIKTAWVGLLILFFPLISAAGEIAVIVNKDNPLSSISSGELVRIYKGRMTAWPSGGLIVAVNQDSHSIAHEEFYKKFLNSKPNEKFFLPGSPIPFRTIIQKSNEEMVNYVGSEVRAIGYVDLDALRGGEKRVKVIKVVK